VLQHSVFGEMGPSIPCNMLCLAVGRVKLIRRLQNGFVSLNLTQKPLSNADILIYELLIV
jgi:hypothetical protein